MEKPPPTFAIMKMTNFCHFDICDQLTFLSNFQQQQSLFNGKLIAKDFYKAFHLMIC